MKHRIEIWYTNMDDGIWLVCDCGWEENLGYTPTFDALSTECIAHLSVAEEKGEEVE